MTNVGPVSLVRLKFLCEVLTDGSHVSPQAQNDGMPYVTVGNVNDGGYIDLEGSARISREDFYRLVRSGCQPIAGDILYSKDGTIGRVAIVDAEKKPFVVLSSFAIIRLRRQQCFPGYFKHALRSDLISDWINASLNGAALRRVTLDVIKELPVPVPALSSQYAISQFLDRKTAQIDALIAAYERLMALLEEKRQAVITQAVTKGLDPTVPMKDSVVEWLGEVPEHWEVKRLKRVVTSMVSGPFGSTLTKDMYTPVGHKVYGQEQVIANDFTVGDYFISEHQYFDMKRYWVTPGDVLISCVGTYGKIAVVPDDVIPGVINPRLIKLRLSDFIPAYFEALFTSDVVKDHLRMRSRGGTMDVINVGLLSDISVLVPPLNEQEFITQHIWHETSDFNKLADAVKKAVALFSEYRSALITAAVTGQIDVTEEVTQDA